MSIRLGMRALALGLAGLGLAALVLTGCGGGGGSSVSGSTGGGSGGGSSSAVVRGQIVTTPQAALSEPFVVVMVRTALGIGLAEAQAGVPVAGAMVTLVGPGGPIASTTTDGSGNFLFENVPFGGPYTLQVSINGVLQIIVLPPPGIIVGAGDEATILGRVTTTGVTGTVNVVARDVSGIVQNDAQLGHAINIDNASSSCDLVRVVELREQGLGWGNIAQQCGASPGVIGLGHSNLSNADLEDGRERSGRGRGRGNGGGQGNGRGNARS